MWKRLCETMLILPMIVSSMLVGVGSANAHDKIGANLNFIGDFRRNHEFADVVKQSRRFLKIGQFDDFQQANLAPIGSDGWPTSDFRIFAMAAQQNTQNLAGAYTIVFNGQADLSTTGGGAGSITGKTFDATTNTTRATLNFPSGAENLLVDFGNTGGTVKNVRIIRPGLNAETPPLLNPPWKAHVQRFPLVRFLDWTRTNGNRDVSWADRTTPQKLKTEAYIAQWETVIDAANWLNRDPWINVPVQANDEYVHNLAILLRDRLNANLNVYVEYGNELWNFGIRDVDMDAMQGGTPFNGASVNASLAEATPPNSPLRFDGESNRFTLGFRRIALRLTQISDIFKEEWGTAAINTRVRPVLAGQMANRFVISEGLRLIDEGLKIQPSSVIYAISGAPYIFPSSVPDGNADETPGLSTQAILDGLSAGVANAPNEDGAYGYVTHAGLAAWYGLKVVAYEAGFDNFGGQNIANKRLANLDPQIKGICKNLINQWHSFGFDHLLWFNAGADSYNTPFGMWPLAEDIADQSLPKNQCIDEILAQSLPAITVGVAVETNSIAGGNFQGSNSPLSALSGLASPFGFPGFVEYLLRAESAGTYSLVFNGSAPAGESFRLRLNNTTVATNFTLPQESGNSSPVTVTLRKGLNAMRIERAVGASWSIVSFTMSLTGDSTPDEFSFLPQTGVTTGSLVTSAPITLTGTNAPTPISISGGEFSVGCTGVFTASAGTIANGQTLCVRHSAAASSNTQTTTVVTIGGISGNFTSTTATATPETFLLTVTNDGNGIVVSDISGISCGSTCTAQFTGGAVVTLVASSAPGFAFSGWRGACTGIDICRVTMLGARAVSAVFAAQVSLAISKSGSGSGTVVSTPEGVNCGSVCNSAFPAGTSVSLMAQPDSGSQFLGWGVSCIGTALCDVTMSEARTVTAAFGLIVDGSCGTANGSIFESAPTLNLCNAGTSSAVSGDGPWTWSCNGSNGGSNASCSATLSNPPRLLNIATRGKVETVDNVMIAGFIIQGSSPKKVLIRARGPSLATAPFNVPGTLSDPFLTLYSGATPIDSNDDFALHANAAQIPADWIPASAKEAAIVTTLNPGAYTAIVNGVGATSGVAIVEVFEIDQPGTPLINIATRGPVYTGDNVMIAGLIIQGDAPKTVLITARGPSMAGPPHNVPGTLSDPVLTLYSGQTPIASNDNWPDAVNASQIQTAIGAPSNTLESAILITLQPGAYTAIVSGADGGTGLAIVEVFAQ